MVSLNNFSRLWGVELSLVIFSSCGGKDRQVDKDPEHENFIKVVALVWTLDWLVCI